MPMATANQLLFTALNSLGALLASRGQAYACVVAGGASLAAMGSLNRTTRDVDVMAVRDKDGAIVLAPEKFPRFLADAIREVGGELKIGDEWMNPQMAAGLKAGMPPGFEARLSWREFGTLHVGFVARRDLIALKLEAASDDPPRGRTAVHLADLVSLAATSDELDEAGHGCST
jgi:hypothetical protein